jgi:DHA1 family tetracycline resistance protein-like MFS transporter
MYVYLLDRAFPGGCPSATHCLMAPNTLASLPSSASEEKAKDRTMAFLAGGFLCWMLGAQLTRSSQVELLLAHFKGDTVAMSRVLGKVSMMSALIGMLVNPIVGSAADAFGRRPVLLLGSVFSVMRPVAWLISPGVTGLILAEIMAPIAQVCAILPPQAAVGDMYKDDPQKLASRQSLLFIVPAMCQIVCPILGGAMAAYRVLLPFSVAAVCAAASGLVALQLPEPLAPEQRRPFRWLQSTPFSALALFVRGRYLRSLAIIQILMDLTETAGRPDRGAAALVELHQTAGLSWGVFERSRFRSLCGLIRTPGNLAVGSMIGWLGSKDALSLGFVNYFFQALTFGLARQGRWHYLVAPSFFFNSLRLNVLTAAMSQHAAVVGLSQGQLRGAVTNLGSLVSMVSGLVWPRVYALGVRAGNPGLFYMPIAVVSVLQLIITRSELGRIEAPVATGYLHRSLSR